MNVRGRRIMNCGLFVITLFAASGLQAQTTTLRYGHGAGTVLHYRLVLDTPLPQASQKVAVTVTRDVAGVDGDIMDIDTAFSNGSLLVNGVNYPFPVAGHILNTKMDRKGMVTETTPVGDFSAMMSAAGIQNQQSVSSDLFRSLGILEFPDDPVAAGSTWVVDKSHNFPGGDTLTSTYTYTVEEFTTYAGYDVVRIRLEAKPRLSFYSEIPEIRRGMLIKGKMNINGIFLFAYNEGKVVKLDETLETSAAGVMIGFDGTAEIVPVYQKTTVTLELQDE